MQYINLNKTLDFETSIVDLLLISIDDQITKNEDKEGIKIVGDIAVSGKVRTLEGEKNFSDKIDLDVFLMYEEIEDRSLLNISVNDFSYNIEEHKLLLNISLKLEGLKEIEKTFLAEEDFENIEEKVEEVVVSVEKRSIDEEIIEEVNEEIVETVKEESEEVELTYCNDSNIEVPSKTSLLKSVFSNRRINEEVSWRLHCVRNEKNYEEIANKYKVNLKKLISMNNNEEITEGKLIFLPLDSYETDN